MAVAVQQTVCAIIGNDISGDDIVVFIRLLNIL